jgi:hypothetical protein
VKTGSIAAALLAVLALAGCGGPSRRTQVDRYLRQVDAVERQFAGALAQAQRTYDAFGRTHAFATESFAHAAQTFVRLRARMAALRPPPAARTVQRDLLRLLDAEVALAREVSGLDAYLRAERAPLARLRSAEQRLRAGLATAKTAPAQRRVFDAFAAEAGAVDARLRETKAPPALARWHRAEVRRVARLRAEAAALADALRRRDPAALRTRLDALRADVAGRDAVAAERAAIRAYDARAAEVGRLASRVEAARGRLEKQLR